MTESRRLLEQLAEAWPGQRWRDVVVVVAVSGGPDSVALLRGLQELHTSGAGRLVLAHFNHGLRPEAQQDEQFVVELGRSARLECRVGHGRVQELALAQGDGIEAAARSARYAFLHQTAHEVGARYIATAHTADDQAETILHRIVRGTGLAGLAGIRRSRPLDQGLALVRPLLKVRRRDVLDYLSATGQPFRMDPSNNDWRFTRNRLRGELLPLLAERFNPQVHEALLRLGRLADESQEVIRALADTLAEQCVVSASPDRLELDLRRAAGQPACVLREMCVGLWQRQGWPLQDMGLAEWDCLAAALGAREPAHHRMLPGGILAQVQGERLRLVRTVAPEAR